MFLVINSVLTNKSVRRCYTRPQLETILIQFLISNRFFHQNSVCLLISPLWPKFAASFNLFRFTALTILGDLFQSRSELLCILSFCTECRGREVERSVLGPGHLFWRVSQCLILFIFCYGLWCDNIKMDLKRWMEVSQNRIHLRGLVLAV